MKPFFISILFLALAAPVVSASVVRLTGEGLCPAGDDYCVRITGEITPADVLAIEDIVNAPRRATGTHPHFMIYLDSPGGDLMSSIRIGRLVRSLERNPPHVHVNRSSQCLSSCVFLLAAGKYRIVDGQVGIHRPYLLSMGAKRYTDTQQDFVNLRAIVEAYLQEVNVRTTLYEDMLSINPEDVNILTPEDLQHYRLSGDDYIQQEMDDSSVAKQYGLTKQEYLIRKQLIDDFCTKDLSKTRDMAAWIKCRERILLK